ncbi:MAG: zinc-binding dehydrogenase [Porticoccaceae bacterium]|nr:MAG: NADH oxidase [SAR92 bacterium MED-G29]
MSMQTSKEIRSTVTSNGTVEISIVNAAMPVPSENEVLIKVEAAPINPSDLALLISFAADLDSIEFSGEDEASKTTIKIRPGLMAALKGRVDQPLSAGNEGAGIVVGAGEKATALIGKTVGVAGGSMYSQYRCAPASSCLVMDEGITSTEAASSFVNPLTALAFVETMKMENHAALVNTAAASNLGQMLVKICKDDEIPLVNIVRKPEQVKILKDLGAEYICDTSQSDFMKDLVEALISTGATLGFDATGGGNEGKLPGQILAAMEVAANKTAKEYSRYGSDVYKQVYIYGGLDPTPTVLNRSYGLQWGLGGWLLTPMIGRIGMERFAEMRQRVVREIKTTFASHYTQEISLEDMLQPDNIKAYAKQGTGAKYLVNPHK